MLYVFHTKSFVVSITFNKNIIWTYYYEDYQLNTLNTNDMLQNDPEFSIVIFILSMGGLRFRNIM